LWTSLVLAAADGADRPISTNLLLNSGFLKTANPGIPDNWFSARGPLYIQEWPQGWSLDEEHAVPGAKSIKVFSPGGKAGRGARYARYTFPKGEKMFSVYLKSDASMPVLLSVLGYDVRVASGREWKRYLCKVPADKNDSLLGIKIEALGKGFLWINAPQLEMGGNVSEYAASLEDAQCGKQTNEWIKPEISKLARPKKGMSYPKFWRVLPDQKGIVWSAEGEGRGGGRAIKMHGLGPKYFSNGDNPVPVSGNATNYRFSCYIKADNVTSAWVDVVALNTGKQWIDVFPLNTPITTKGSHDWRKFEVLIPRDKFPAGMEFLGFWCWADGKDDGGTVWWDDFLLVDVDRPAANLLQNSGFEEYAGGERFHKEWQMALNSVE